MQIEKSFQPAKRAQWQPMRLTPVGQLGSVIRGTVGSVAEGGNKKTA